MFAFLVVLIRDVTELLSLVWIRWQCGLLEPLEFRFCSRFSLRGVHYYALGGDFKGRQPLA